MKTIILAITSFLATLSVQALEERPIVSVIQDYGRLIVKPGTYVQEATIKPWSSWWYPDRDAELYFDNQNNSPLEKYDRFVLRRTKQDPMSREVEAQKHDPRSAANWDGLCDAWALASILRPEPRNAVSLDGVLFEVKDIKALLLKTYEDVPGLKIYGQKNEDGWDHIYADIFPHEFHKFVQAELFEKRMPFIMDHDAGYPTWNVPVYKAFMEITVDNESQPTKLLVTTKLVHATSHLEGNYNFVGTKPMMRSYTYELSIKEVLNEGYLVDDGRWVGDSRKDHPDYLIPRPAELQMRKSENERIDNNIVDFLVRESTKQTKP